MRKLLHILLFVSLPFIAISQNIKGDNLKIKEKSKLIGQVTIGSASFNSSAILTIESSSKGMLTPRMTTAQRDGIGSPSTGLLIFNTTTNQFEFFETTWRTIGGIGGNTIYTADDDLTSNRTVTMGPNSLTFSGNLTTLKGLNATSSNFALKVTDNTGTTPMLFVRNDGNVGINEGTPTSKLHIVGDDSGPTALVKLLGSSGKGPTFFNDGNVVFDAEFQTKCISVLGGNNLIAFEFNTSGGQRIFIGGNSGAGRIGINNSAGSGIINLDAKTTSFFNQSVIIGSSLPPATGNSLDVRGNFILGNSSAPLITEVGNSDIITLRAKYNFTGTVADFDATMQILLDAPAASPQTGRLAFSVEGNEGLVIDETGNVGIGTTDPATSAILEISSTTGAVLFPRMTTGQRDALTAVNGMVIYNNSLDKLQVRAAGAWVSLH